MANASEKKVIIWTLEDRKILHKICNCLAVLGATSDLLGTVESWKSSLPNKDVSSILDSWYIQALNDKKDNFYQVLKYCKR